jgi:hypothetical protein
VYSAATGSVVKYFRKETWRRIPEANVMYKSLLVGPALTAQEGHGSAEVGYKNKTQL